MTISSIPGLCSIFSKTPLPKLQRNTQCPPFCLSLGFLGKRLSLSLVFDDLETSVFIAFAWMGFFLFFEKEFVSYLSVILKDRVKDGGSVNIM